MILYYSDDIINHVHQSSFIEEVIGERIKINHKGKDFVAVCPFHSDTNPSLHISTSKQIYKCFACGVGGNIFKFIIDYDKISFPEAVEKIAQKYGITLPQKKKKSTSLPYEKIKGLNEVAADIFKHCLLNDPQARIAKEYLIKRKLTAKIINHFKIGYAPDNYHFLNRLFAKKNISEKLMIESGLCRKKENTQNKFKNNTSSSNVYDFFRGRIMFPIHNEKNSIIGFGGRAIKDQTAKYINTAETILFKKKYILYGLNYVLNNNRHHSLICVVEGYLDVIACLTKVNIPAVAPLGTALTIEQINNLKRFCEEIVIVFDSDEAGKKAALKAVTLLLKIDVKSTVIMLPADEDPFSLLIEKESQGNEKEELFKKLINDRQEIDDFLIQYLNLHEGLSLSEKQEKYQQLSQIINNAKSPLIRESIEKKAARILNVSEEALKQSVNHPPKNIIKKYPSSQTTPTSNQVELINQKKERDFILFLILHPEYIKLAGGLIGAEDILDKMTKYIYKILLYKQKAWEEDINNIEKHNSTTTNSNAILDITLKYFDNETVKSFLREQIPLKIEEEKETYKSKNPDLLKKDFNQRLHNLKCKILQKSGKEHKIKIEQLSSVPDRSEQQQQQLERLQSEHQAIMKNIDNIKRNMFK